MNDTYFRWGVLSGARIARQKVIPAIQQSLRGRVIAIASRNVDHAREIARSFQIPHVCSTYHDLIHLDGIDAVYIPLPNHLHVEWASNAIKAGKHVLCEKPLGLSETEAQTLLRVSQEHPRQIVAEAFMYRYHPQWGRIRELIRSKEIGELRSIYTHFSYTNEDPENIRNILEFGGGALMDIGCYGISVARWLYGAEPLKVCAQIERHPEFKTDMLTTVLLKFPHGSATVVCGTQMYPSQRVILVGTKGKIVVPKPFIISPDEAACLYIERNEEVIPHELRPANQFSEQCDGFAAGVSGTQTLHTTLSDSIFNMRVIDACFRSEREESWIHC